MGKRTPPDRASNTARQFPISHVQKLRNMDEGDFKYPGDNEGDVRGGSYEVQDRGYNDKFAASASFEIPGSKTQYNWGSAPARTTEHSDAENAQDTFDTPNAARQAAVNNASAKHVAKIKNGDFVREEQYPRKGGTVKIDSNPSKGK